MPRRRKHAVRKFHGTMCNICGKNCGRGGPLKTHLKGEHLVDYEIYMKCFYPDKVKLLANNWHDSNPGSSGSRAIYHVLVRRIVSDPGPRGVPNRD
jgi:hypothetical protein